MYLLLIQHVNGCWILASLVDKSLVSTTEALLLKPVNSFVYY